MGVAKTLKQVEDAAFHTNGFIVRFDKLEDLINDTYSKICEALKVINNNQSFYRVSFYFDVVFEGWGYCSIWVEKSLLGKRRTNIRYSFQIPISPPDSHEAVIVNLYYRKHSKIPFYLEKLKRVLASYGLNLEKNRIIIPLEPGTIEVLNFLV